jgi:uncharacterized protein (DUF983 family)
MLFNFIKNMRNSQKPKPPPGRVIRQGVGKFCPNCGSTMSRSGFLKLFGKRHCDDDKCPNGKSKQLTKKEILETKIVQLKIKYVLGFIQIFYTEYVNMEDSGQYPLFKDMIDKFYS